MVQLTQQQTSAQARSTPHPLISFVLNTYSTGELRALARAQVNEVSANVFQITPNSLRAVSGSAIPWVTPMLGMPIETATTFDGAHDLLVQWATKTVFLYAGANALELSPEFPFHSNIVEAYSEGERRAFAQGYLRRIMLAPDMFSLTPFLLREIAGRVIYRATSQPRELLTSRENAEACLSWWATQMMAMRAGPAR